MSRDYSYEPLKVNQWTHLTNFDQHEAKEAGWSQETITACLREIQRREVNPHEPCKEWRRESTFTL